MALLDLVAAVVSLVTSCNIQTPSNIQRRQMRLAKKCKLLFIEFYYFFDFLKDNRIKITVSVINKHGNLNKSCIGHNIYFI